MIEELDKVQMRMRGRVDNTQGPIVDALRDIGASVAITSPLGGGFGDLVVGFRGVNVLLEAKTGNEPLTAAETKFHGEWNGQVAIVRTPEEAQLAVISHWQACGGKEVGHA